MNLDKSSIERLKKRLYSRTEEEVQPVRRRMRDFSSNEATSMWATDTPMRSARNYNSQAILKYVLWGSLGFFLIALLVSAFLITQSSPISPKKVKIEIQGPAAIGGGEVLTLQILIRNENSAAIEDAELVIEFPEGTRSSTDLETDLPRIREPLGTIASGDDIQKTTKAVLFGVENSEQIVRMYVEYRVAGSSATFSSGEQTYPLVLTSAPLSVLVESVKEITSGQVIEFTVTAASNSDTPLKDVLLSVEYPFGFSFESASPAPAFRNSVWELGELKPEEKKVIKLRGKMTGENEEERLFRFAAGSRSARNETEVGTAFMTALETVTIKKPFIGVDLAINGVAGGQATVGRGERVRGDISWFNNLPSRIYDAEITLKIGGEAVDKRTITAPKGFYRSGDNTIIWTRETEENLEELNEGSRGSISFSFETLDLTEGTLRQPSINLVVNLKGKRLSENNVPETIEATITQTVKVASDLLLTSRAVYFAGPFDNAGPMPPEADKKTTYTVLWTVTNSSNPVRDVTVSAALPSYVRFTDSIEPGTADVAYSPVGGKVTWNVGALAPGARKDVAFQVELEPSLGQVGTAPTLVGVQSVSGVDGFTSASLSDSRPALTTRLTTDPDFKSGQELVVE